MDSRLITPKKIKAVKPKDLTSIFKKCKATFVKSALKKGESITGFKLPEFSGLIRFELQPDYRLGTEFAEISKITAGVGGILHSDELPKFGITQKEVDSVNKTLKVNENDGFILIIGPSNLANLAIDGIKNMISMWITNGGIVPEVRSPRANGTTGFLRPLPGKARMYPETDSKPIPLSSELLDRIEKTKFEMPEDRAQRYTKKLKLSKDLADQLVLHPKNTLFEEIVNKHKLEPKLVANTLISTIVDIRRQGYDTTLLTNAKYHELFQLVAESKISSDAISQMIIGIIENPSDNAEGLIESLGLIKMDSSEIEGIISSIIEEHLDLIKERGMGAMGNLMGKAMAQLTGKADGKLISDLIRKGIQSKL